NGLINFAGDTDSFTINLDPGQTITLVVAPGSALAPTVALRDPSNTLLGSASAAAGQKALLQTIATTTGGGYTIIVGEMGGTTGTDNVQVSLNAAREGEGLNGSGYTAAPVAFAFNDISGTGAPVLQGTDDSVWNLGPADLNGFTFTFYGQTYDSIFFSTNGLVTFGS